MGQNLEVIELLMIKEIHGTISAKEKKLLKHLTDRSSKLQQRKEELQEKLQSEDFQNYIKQYNEYEEFEKLKKRIHRRKRNRNTLTKVIIIVAISIFTMVLFRIIWSANS